MKKKINLILLAVFIIAIIITIANKTTNIKLISFGIIAGIICFLFYLNLFKYKINYVFKITLILFFILLLLIAGNVFAFNIARFFDMPVRQTRDIYTLFSAILLFFSAITLFSKSAVSSNADLTRTKITLPVAADITAKDKLLDTSVIIDGRIVDLCNLNFIEGTIIIPKFILKELQTIADSHDNLKRNRGRRGLEVLNRIQNDLKQSIKIVEDDFREVKEADEKLILLAKQTGAALITNDYNLNKVAELQNIQVVNLNDLANALKPIMLPGEPIEILIVKEGKEHNQGIGYLNDGTMVVIDNANKNLNKIVKAIVTSAIQTSAGRMIFGKKPEDLK